MILRIRKDFGDQTNIEVFTDTGTFVEVIPCATAQHAFDFCGLIFPGNPIHVFLRPSSPEQQQEQQTTNKQ